MLKAPRPGFVKTRLAAEIGDGPAAAVYRYLVEGQVARIPRDWRVAVHYAPPDAGLEMTVWLAPLLPPGTTFHPQPDGTLGDRMIAALAGAPDGGPVLFVGGDCPGLDARRLRALERLTRSVGAAVIPATDGGYTCIGLHARHAFAFEGIAWSTPRVLEQTRAAFLARGAPLRVSSPAVDDVDDLASLLKACAGDPALGRIAGHP